MQDMNSKDTLRTGSTPNANLPGGSGGAVPSSDNGRARFSDNALRVLERRYLIKDEQGNICETPEQLLNRVSTTIAEADKSYPDGDPILARERFYSLLYNLEFLPNSPTLMNAGTQLGQLSACFVLPVEDSMARIFSTLKHAALIHKSGGGTGFSFSRLRPQNDVVNSTTGISSGPISFMKVFDAATDVIKQGGKRRGANMGVLRVDHPDIMDFVRMKSDMNTLTNFNISVAVTDVFMEAVLKDKSYELVNPRTGEPVQTQSAREVFDAILNEAWRNGDPGLIFIDEVNRKNPVLHVGEIESTNPCGEQPLLPYESCNLGSINLNKFLNPDSTDVDWVRLESAVDTSVHFLDNVIDVNAYPIPEIAAMTRKTRKIGLGVMGFADMLYRLAIPYDSEEGCAMGEKVMEFVNRTARNASMRLADTRGTFPAWEGSSHARDGVRMRNACVTTCAPTGTIGMLAEASGGLEPNFALSYVKNVMDGTKLLYTNHYFEEVARRRGFYSDALMSRIAETGSCQDIEEIPEDVRRVFVIAADITPQWHIKMQAAYQRHVDSAVSKTVNFPAAAKKEDIAEVYMLAYSGGCKGVTVYRDGCRESQVLNRGTGLVTDEDYQSQGSSAQTEGSIQAPTGSVAPELRVRPRPDIVTGATRKVLTGCGNLYVTINKDEGNAPFEVFSQMGKAGGCAASQTEAISRLISLALRSGVPMKEITRQLSGINCHRPAWSGGEQIHSCSDAIAKSLVKDLSPEDLKQDNLIETQTIRGACPDCGGSLVHEMGCAVCRDCAYSECA